jgi:TRAP-type C4-dicarboxylate transport system substrate-binding protein
VKKLVIIALVVILVFSFIFSACGKTSSTTISQSSTQTSTPVSGQTIVLRLGLVAPPTDFNAIEPQKMADRFNARAQGKYKIEVYPAESIVKMGEQMNAARTGAVEMVNLAPGMQSAVDPRFGAMDMPFVFKSWNAKIAALEPIGEIFDKALQEKFNQKLVGLWCQPTYNTISTKPIKTLADWKGLLVLPLGPIVSDVVKVLGGAPVDVPWPEGYDSLQKGVIDVIISGYDSIISFRFYDVARYTTHSGMINSGDMYTMNLDVWKAMPKDIQDILLEEMQTGNKACIDHFANSDTSNIEALKKAGVDVYELPDAEFDKWREVTLPLYDSYYGSMGADGQKALDIINQVNKDNP